MMRYLRCLSGLLSWLCRPLSGMGGLFFALMYLVGATSVGFEPWNGSRFWMLFELFADLYVVCLLLVLLLIFIGQWLIVTFGGRMFRTQPLSAEEWLIITAATSVVLIAGELWRGIKRIKEAKA